MDKIAVDAMGGDFAPLEIVLGAVQAVREVIEMGEHPGMAYRKKKDASVSVGARLVKSGECGALIAPGSTGAAVTAGLLGIGRIKGIERPAILTPIPNESPRWKPMCRMPFWDIFMQ